MYAEWLLLLIPVLIVSGVLAGKWFLDELESHRVRHWWAGEHPYYFGDPAGQVRYEWRYYDWASIPHEYFADSSHRIA